MITFMHIFGSFCLREMNLYYYSFQHYSFEQPDVTGKTGHGITILRICSGLDMLFITICIDINFRLILQTGLHNWCGSRRHSWEWVWLSGNIKASIILFVWGDTIQQETLSIHLRKACFPQSKSGWNTDL